MPPEILNDADLEILALLWKQGQLKPAEIQSRLSYEIKNSALRWQLGELVRIGLLERKRDGKAYVYFAAKARQTVFDRLAGQLKKILFGGSALAMVGELIDNGHLSKAELQELAKRLQKSGKKRAKS